MGIKAFAAEMRRYPTPIERAMWGYLKNSPQGYKFKCQHIMGRRILDFYCERLRLAVEVDGRYHEKQRQADLVRSRELIDEFHITILRYPSDQCFSGEAMKDLSLVLTELTKPRKPSRKRWTAQPRVRRTVAPTGKAVFDYRKHATG